MNVLLLGSGGRESALAWKIARSPLIDHLYCMPGNPGTAAIATNVDCTLRILNPSHAIFTASPLICS